MYVHTLDILIEDDLLNLYLFDRSAVSLRLLHRRTPSLLTLSSTLSSFLLSGVLHFDSEQMSFWTTGTVEGVMKYQ